MPGQEFLEFSEGQPKEEERTAGTQASRLRGGWDGRERPESRIRTQTVLGRSATTSREGNKPRRRLGGRDPSGDRRERPDLSLFRCMRRLGPEAPRQHNMWVFNGSGRRPLPFSHLKNQLKNYTKLQTKKCISTPYRTPQFLHLQPFNSHFRHRYQYTQKLPQLDPVALATPRGRHQAFTSHWHRHRPPRRPRQRTRPSRPSGRG